MKMTKDIVGIIAKLQRSPDQTAKKRDLFRARRRKEREFPGRWLVGYLQLKESGRITETGTGRRGDPIFTTLVPSKLPTERQASDEEQASVERETGACQTPAPVNNS
jgi:hypothetical protein